MTRLFVRELFNPGGAYGLAVIRDVVVAHDTHDTSNATCVRLLRAQLVDGREIGRIEFEADDVYGLTSSGEHLVALVTGGSSSGPGDWGTTLRWHGVDDELLVETPLGPGNWSVVTEPPRGPGELVIVYDTTEEQGLRAFDSHAVEIWRTSFGSVSRLLRGARDRLLAHAWGENLVTELDELTGAVTWQVPAPQIPDVRWTASAAWGEDILVAGSVGTRGSIIGVARRGSGVFDVLSEIPVTAYVPAERLEHRHKEAVDCGFDLTEVAYVGPLADGAIAVVVGGAGTMGAACHGSCAAAIVFPGDTAWDVVELNKEESITAVLRLADDHVLINCWGTVYQVKMDGAGCGRA